MITYKQYFQLTKDTHNAVFVTNILEKSYYVWWDGAVPEFPPALYIREQGM